MAVCLERLAEARVHWRDEIGNQRAFAFSTRRVCSDIGRRFLSWRLAGKRSVARHCSEQASRHERARLLFVLPTRSRFRARVTVAPFRVRAHLSRVKVDNDFLRLLVLAVDGHSE